jgi:CheY-like chemotaxis protein
MAAKRVPLILIVEDESAMRRVLEKKLKGAGFRVATAGDGVSGLEAAMQKQPSLILLDIIMPRMDGVTMLRRLRTNPKTTKIPVIILTNLTDGPLGNQVDMRKVADYLIKTDWSLDEILQKIRAHLEGAKPTRRLA